jgi:hypothetical protein
MSTATGPTLICGYCRSTVDAADLGGDLARWQCTHCDSWNDRPHDPLELLKQEARDEVDEIARTMLAALELVQEASRQELGSPKRQEIMGRALPLVRAAIAAAKAAGIGEK